jgi:hypothetical protein
LVNVLDQISGEIRQGNIVLWTGAGFNHHAGLPSGAGLARLIRENSGPNERPDLESCGDDLSRVAECFVQMRQGVRDDLHRIVLKAMANDTADLALHVAISDMPQIDTIITTNYDNLFERVYGNRLGVITPSLVGYRDALQKGVRLFKIHGDMAEPNSVLITTGDYTRFFANYEASPLWKLVWSTIAQKTVLFVGYSFGDQNVEFMFEQLLSAFGPNALHSYLVAPSIPGYRARFLERHSITAVNGTAEAFVPELRKRVFPHLLEDVKAGLVPPSKTSPVLRKQSIAYRFVEDQDGNRMIDATPKAGAAAVHHVTVSLAEHAVQRISAFKDDPQEESLEIPPEDLIALSESIGDVIVPHDDTKGTFLRLEKIPNKSTGLRVRSSGRANRREPRRTRVKGQRGDE